jgi:hypothetical protein
MFNRKTSAPRAISCRIVSDFSVAGPSVQMIFVFRIAQKPQVLAAGNQSQKERHAGEGVPLCKLNYAIT